MPWRLWRGLYWERGGRCQVQGVMALSQVCLPAWVPSPCGLILCCSEPAAAFPWATVRYKEEGDTRKKETYFLCLTVHLGDTECLIHWILLVDRRGWATWKRLQPTHTFSFQSSRFQCGWFQGTFFPLTPPEVSIARRALDFDLRLQRGWVSYPEFPKAFQSE